MVRFEDFAKLVHDPAFPAALGIPFDSAEGFLFPDTYLIMSVLELNETTVKSVVGRLIDNFWRRTARFRPRRQASGPPGGTGCGVWSRWLPSSRETAVLRAPPRRRGKHANRLRLNMLLQADPTTAYGLGALTATCGAGTSTTNPTLQHLQSACLPPGPICSPGPPASRQPPILKSTTTFILSRAGKTAPMCSAPI